MERLDFQHKKAALEGESSGRSRMLSSFNYGTMKAYLFSQGYREGVEVCQASPTHSSVIGRMEYMERYGLSAHQAAAQMLARGLLSCREGVPASADCPVGHRRTRRLRRTREEAREARVVVLGSHHSCWGGGGVR